MTEEAGSAIVTGAAGGIGSAVVAHLARAGWAVVGTDLVEPGPDLRGATTAWVAGDVCDAAVRDATLTAATSVGPLTGLVTATLSERRGRMLGLDAADFADVYAVQVGAVAELSAAAVESGSEELSIVHVSSVHALGAADGMASYAAAKAALGALTRASALEWGPRGVRCNAVLPGFVPVPRNARRWGDADAVARMIRSHPLRRLVTPDDVADVVGFLLGRTSRGITGAAIPVDGGMTAVLPAWA